MNSDWHRAAGTGLAWELSNAPFKLIQELDLSLRRVLVDFALIRMEPVAEVELPFYWPDLADGIQNLSLHNLLTYKGPGQSLQRWHLSEAAGFLVDYAKLEFRGDWDPLKENAIDSVGGAEEAEEEESDEWMLAREAFIRDFIESGRGRVYAVSTHRPQWLNPKEENWQTELNPGVYELSGFDLPLRLIVPRAVDLTPKNALWHLLSGVPDRIKFGLDHCELKDRELFSMLKNQLERNFSKEGVIMPATVEDYRREWREELLAEATAEERLKGLSPKERLEGLKPKERLEGLTEEEIREAMKLLGLGDKDTGGDVEKS